MWWKSICNVNLKANQCCRSWIRLRQCLRSSSSATINNQTYTNPKYEGAKPFSDIPGPKGLPYLGTLFQYTRGPYSVDKYHEAVLQRYETYGPIFKETIAGDTVVHLMHPEYCKEMYALEGKVPHIPPLLETVQMYREYREMSPGLGNTNGETWYRLRTNVNQMMMRPKAVTQFLPQVNEVISDFVQRLDRISAEHPERIVNDLRNEILLWNLESSANTCFETRLGSFECGPQDLPQQMLDANSKIFALSLKLKFGIPWFKMAPKRSAIWKSLVEAEDFFFGKAQKIVDKTVATIKQVVDKGELKEGDFVFMTYLLGKENLNYKDVSIITMSLFSDGLGTTAPTLLGQLYCLANNPEKQEKLYAEVQKLAPDSDAPITADMINQASYLKACIKEGFRFFPIGTEVSRIPQRDVVIAGYQIPAGTHVELNQNMLLCLPEYFITPDQYTPERWIRGQSEEIKGIHPYLLLPFGYGPRTCAGRRFAEQEMNVMIMKLLQRFRLEWPHKEPMTQRYNMLLTPDGPETIRFVPRH